MREIKFRAKPRNTLEIVPWVYGDYLTIRLDGHPTGMIHKPYELFDREPDDPYTEVIESTLGQYTGLKDKNGKEIYEGDIVYTSATNHFHEIRFGEFRAEDSDSRYVGFYWHDLIEHEDVPFGPPYDAQYGVIGNIYENPELLEKA